jgi:hypothetical protein
MPGKVALEMETQSLASGEQVARTKLNQLFLYFSWGSRGLM